jgi:hypothetical protein
MTTITVVATKTDWAEAEYIISIDGAEADGNDGYDDTLDATSEYLSQSSSCYSEGIFNSVCNRVKFTRDATSVLVDFESPWDYSKYANPAQEIARRVRLVNEAFEAVRDSYERTYTVTI